MITLEDGTTTVDLSEFVWKDKLTWSGVTQSIERSLTGSLIIDTTYSDVGRPITLESSEKYGWVSKATLDTLLGWYNTADKQLTLTVGSVEIKVIFRHYERPAMDFTPVVDYSSSLSSDYYYGTIKLIEV